MHHPFISLAVTLFMLSTIPTIDYLIFGHITGFSLLLGFLLCVVLWVRLASRRKRKSEETEADARLRRRALYHLNGERGEVSGMLLLGVLFFLALMAMTVQLCAADPAQIDAILSEASAQLFPRVPLSGDELTDLQAVALAVAVICKQLQTFPPEMTNTTRERRLQMKRELEKAHAVLVDTMISHAGAVIQASRKGGAR